jgi:SAM-dependent methyltransferase
MLNPSQIICCPACSSDKGRPVGDFASGFETTAGGETFRHPGYQVIRCAECALHYKSAACDASTLSDYYSKLEFESYEYAGLFPTDKQVIRLLGKLPDQARVLDFGCGVGRILASSTKRLDCHGVEVNDRASRVASERGITIHDEAGLLADPVPRFDAIILTDVFEHLVSPIELLSGLVKLLRPDGRLILVTGNADAIPSNSFSAEFWYYRILGHLQMASVKHLHWLAERLHLKLADVILTSHYAWPFSMRVKQALQHWAYTLFRTRPQSLLARLVAQLPLLGRARQWRSAPTHSSGCDHFVAVFINN